MKVKLPNKALIDQLRKYHGKEAVKEYLEIVERIKNKDDNMSKKDNKNGHRNERIV